MTTPLVTAAVADHISVQADEGDTGRVFTGLQALRDGLVDCQRRSAKAGEPARGRLVMGFSIRSERVASAAIDEDTTGSPLLSGCALDKVRTFEFAGVNAANVIFPLELELRSTVISDKAQVEEVVDTYAINAAPDLRTCLARHPGGALGAGEWSYEVMFGAAGKPMDVIVKAVDPNPDAAVRSCLNEKLWTWDLGFEPGKVWWVTRTLKAKAAGDRSRSQSDQPTTPEVRVVASPP